MKSSVLFLLLMLLAPGLQAQPDHEAWTSLLRDHVRSLDSGVATQLDYAGLQQHREHLTAYLTSLSRITPAEFASWSRADQLAFLINAYNAWTVELILTAYPDLESIRDLGSFLRSPWQKKNIPLLGETLSLDQIEHDMIRAPGVFDDPRIHFAVNCASIGCPALRWEAYIGATLEAQLQDATRLFLSDRSRNRFENGRLHVSEIFRWYREDFEKAWRATDSVGEFIAQYYEALGLDSVTTQRLAAGEIPLRYLDYDWRLNDLTRP